MFSLLLLFDVDRKFIRTPQDFTESAVFNPTATYKSFRRMHRQRMYTVDVWSAIRYVVMVRTATVRTKRIDTNTVGTCKRRTL